MNSVGAYDHHENKWTNLPGMIKGRYSHGAVSMGNKMFVIGKRHDLTCEVFDSVSRKFTNIKERIQIHSGCDSSLKKIKVATFRKVILQPVGIGKQVIVLCRFDDSASKNYLSYDVLTNQWKLEEKNDFFQYKFCI